MGEVAGRIAVGLHLLLEILNFRSWDFILQVWGTIKDLNHESSNISSASRRNGPWSSLRRGTAWGTGSEDGMVGGER